MGQRVIPATCLDMRASCGALARRGIPGEPQTLALATPAPVGLAGGYGRVVHQTVIPAPYLGMRTSRRTLALRGVAGEPQTLALAAPAPIALRSPSHGPSLLSSTLPDSFSLKKPRLP